MQGPRTADAVLSSLVIGPHTTNACALHTLQDTGITAMQASVCCFCADSRQGLVDRYADRPRKGLTDRASPCRSLSATHLKRERISCGLGARRRGQFPAEAGSSAAGARALWLKSRECESRSKSRDQSHTQPPSGA